MMLMNEGRYRKNGDLYKLCLPNHVVHAGIKLGIFVDFLIMR